ncbi:hypothetical protein ASG29_01660 [Sphingomonas sp. Leaf412]|uniref:PEPxxWA-CTERM sorting domain-containing protein n=1 Tax=Sphingomonas sp. Leaf412 TaxID=1736370 RepID=UPI0006FDB670|nr:PEPxxWA-CTERM sorting domain-containing protein [Sphingomonas sp. Leaf412]KQT34887.1 hypothetical protein ASG29_01660 [Sphingomonas sp. Leaf412]
MFKLTFIATAALLSAVPAAAITTLDFDAARGRNGRTGYVYGAWAEEGYRVAADRCSSPAGTCFVTTGTALTSLDRTGAALTNFLGGAVTTLSRADGGAFRLLGMEMAGNYGNFSGFGAPTLGVTFTYTFADGTIATEARTLANTPGQRLTINDLSFPAQPLTSVAWRPGAGTSGFLQFDDIRLAAGVPEPATWALMIVGLGAVGARMRRRRIAPAAA